MSFKIEVPFLFPWILELKRESVKYDSAKFLKVMKKTKIDYVELIRYTGIDTFDLRFMQTTDLPFFMEPWQMKRLTKKLGIKPKDLRTTVKGEKMPFKIIIVLWFPWILQIEIKATERMVDINKLMEARIEAGVELTELATHIGVSRTYLWQRESSEIPFHMKPWQIKRAAKKLKVKPKDLLEEDRTKN